MPPGLLDGNAALRGAVRRIMDAANDTTKERVEVNRRDLELLLLSRMPHLGNVVGGTDTFNPNQK